MPARNARVDAYIARSAEFARPLLEHFRAVVHDACPTVEETLKWGHPHFMYHGMMCGMAAANTSSGSRARRRRRPAPGGWQPRWSGWRRESPGIGSMSGSRIASRTLPDGPLRRGLSMGHS